MMMKKRRRKGKKGRWTSECEELRRRWRRLADCRMQEEIFSVARALSAVLPCVSAGTPAILDSRGLPTSTNVFCFRLVESARVVRPRALHSPSFSSLALFLFSLSPTLALVPLLHPFRCLHCCCMIASEEAASIPTTIHVTLAMPPPRNTYARSLST